MKEEVFRLLYDKETNKLELEINKDLIDYFQVDEKTVENNLDYDLIDKIKNNIIDICKKGTLLNK